MRTLLTGASGFLGHYIKAEFSDPLTLGRSPTNDISCDLAEEIPILPRVDRIVHNAGLAHTLPKTPGEVERFYKVNVEGTFNLLRGIEQSGHFPHIFIFISSVAVYGIEQGEDIGETIEPRPNTPYGESKLRTELLLAEWAKKHAVKLVVLRLPLVAGAINTPGNLGAMLRAISRNYYFRIGSGSARKSMVLAKDVARLIPTLRTVSGTFNLTDGVNPSMAELDTYLSGHFGKPVRSLPTPILQILSKVGDLLPFFPINSYRLQKLSYSLTFDDSKAKTELQWSPKPVIGNLF